MSVDVVCGTCQNMQYRRYNGNEVIVEDDNMGVLDDKGYSAKT